MGKTRVLGLDVYGTILPTKGKQVKRKGLNEFLERCKDQGLVLCTCSDAHMTSLMGDFKEAEIPKKYFDSFFIMPRKGKDFYNRPKDFRFILEYYGLINHPEKFTVIGDREARDIIPARELGCNAIWVPEYATEEQRDDFDLNSLELP